MSSIRKFIVRNFDLSTYIVLFGKRVATLRAARIIAPIFTLIGTIITADPNYPAIQWYDVVMLLIIAFLFWLGFNFFNKGYFGFFPWKFEELDDEQRYNYLGLIKDQRMPNPELGKMVYGPLMGWQVEEFDRVEKLHFEQYKGKKFAGLWNLLPLLIALLLIVNWAVWIMPMVI